MTTVARDGFHFGTKGRRDALRIVRSMPDTVIFEVAGHNTISDQDERWIADQESAIRYIKDFPGEMFTLAVY